MKKQNVIFLTFLILFAVSFSFSGMEFFHHHSDNNGESNCIVCILTASVTVLPDSDVRLTFDAPENYFLCISIQNSFELINQFNSTNYPDRAPPQI